MAFASASIRARRNMERSDRSMDSTGPAFADALEMEARAVKLQAAFRGYNARRALQKNQIHVKPQEYLKAVKRHENNRKGFILLCSYIIYSFLFIAITQTVVNPTERYYFESSLRDAISSVTLGDETPLSDIGTPSQAMEFAAALVDTLYTTGSSEVVLGRPVTPERSAKMGGYVTQAMNRLFPSNGPSVNPEHRKQMYDAALVLAPELRSTEPGFNCLDTLAKAHVTYNQTLGLTPTIVAGWSVLFERLEETGELYPKVEHGAGEFRTYSRLTGGFSMLQERRSGRECLIGQHEDVFHQCYESDADPEVEQFVGSYTNNTYVRNEHADAFVQLLDIGPFGFGRRVTNCAVQELVADGWVDESTHTLALQLSLINGNLRIIGVATITFEFTLGGAVDTTISVNAVTFPGRDAVLGLDVGIFVLVIIFFLLSLLRFTFAIVQFVKRIRSKSMNWTAALLFIFVVGTTAVYVAALGVQMTLAVDAGNVESQTPEAILEAADPIKAQTATTIELKELAASERVFKTLVSISYLLLLGGLIAPLSFHERLAVITKTLSAGATDLFHFFIVFMAITMLYALAASTMFGTLLEEFQDIWSAYNTLMLILLGDFDLPAMAEAAPDVAALFFWSYCLIAFFLLLNVFLSIVVDAYMTVKENTSESPSIVTSLIEVCVAAAYDLKTKCRRDHVRLKVVPRTPRAGDGHSSFTDKAITSPHGGAGAGAGATATDGAAEVDIAALPIQRKPTKPDFLSQARYAYPLSREITDCLKPLCEARAKQIEALPEDAVDESVYLTRFHIRKALGMHYTRATIDDIMLMFGDENNQEYNHITPAMIARHMRAQRKLQKRTVVDIRHLRKELADLKSALHPTTVAEEA